MAIAKFTVKVDRTQLDTLQKEVTKLQNKTINIKVDQSGVKATQDISKNIEQTAKAAQDASASLSKMAQEVDKVSQLLGKPVAKLNDLSILKDGQKLKEYVKGMEGLNKATVDAAGAARVGSEHFQVFDATIKEGNGLVSKSKVFFNNLTGEIYQTSQGFHEATSQSNALLENLKKYARWYIIGNIFSKIVGELRQAINEMKNVDTELITVRKVTDMTEAELRKLTDTAYDTAAALGATASAFLNAVSTFSKAGYDEQSEALGELAIMAANVGDTTQETANQFLLAVDKAYKYEGSVEELTRVLDGANEIGNQFATDVEHIASGLGTVAPVAAQMGVSIDELTAAIGTITAVTQRSGTEAARALRALFLNIMGDTKTEIDDGVTWTKDEIDSLNAALETYAKDAVETAKATGQVINPMEAMGALAKSLKEGTLAADDLASIASGIGGKLRSSQLLALIQNWDMYEQMMSTYAGAAGSAEREYSIYLDSWIAKTNELSAAWTSLVSNLIETDTIKMSISALTEVIKVLDTTAGRFIITGTAVGLTLQAISDAAAFVGSKWALGRFAIALKEGESLLGAFTSAVNPTLIAVAAVIAGFTAFVHILKASNEELEEQREKVASLEEEQRNLLESDGEYYTLKAKKTEELTEQEKIRLSVLEATIEANKELLRQEKEKEWELFQKQFNPSASAKEDRGITTKDQVLSQSFASVSDKYKNGGSLSEYISGLNTIIADNKTVYDYLVSYKEMGFELTPQMENFISMFETVISELETVKTETDDIASSVEGVKQAATIEGILGKVAEGYEKLKKAQDDVNKLGVISSGTVQEISEKYSGLMKYLVQTKNGYVLAENALETYLAAQKKEYEISLYEAKQAALNVLGDENSKANAYALTTTAIIAQLKAKQALVETETLNKFEGRAGGQGVEYYQLQRMIDLTQAAQDALDNYEAAAETIRRSERGGSGSSSKSEKDAELERLKAIVALRESELALMEKQGKSTGEQIGKIKEIQAALHNQAEYLRKSKDYLNGDAKALAEVNALSKQWLDYQQKIADLQKKLQDELEDAVNDKLKKARDTRDAEIKKIDEEIKRQKELKDNVEKQNELEEKINDVLEKRKALQNALNERNVRYYNAKTGQWEWGANAKNVADAKKDLEDAEDALTKYRKDLKYEAAIADLEKRKDAINQMYDDLEDEWGKITDSLQKPTRSIASILSDIAKNGTPEMKKQVENVSALLQKLGVYIGNVTGQQPVDLIGEVPAGQTVTNGGKTYTQLDYRGKITSADGKKLYEQLASGKVSTVTDSNGNTWEYAGNGVVRVYTDAGNTYLADVSGVSKSGSGSGGSGGSSGGKSGSNSKPASTGMVGIDNKTYTKEERDIADRQGVDLGTARKMKEYMDRNPNGEKYDSGGILYGMGGIKATNENEMILPPSVTKQMLKPSANKDFQQRLSELKFMYGASKTVPSTLIANTGDGGIEKQYNGDIYQYGNVTLTREEAKHTSIYDLVQLSNKLSIYSKAN